VSQPIEDKTNELISGSRADVQISIFGDELEELRRVSDDVAGIVRGIQGSGDVRVERLLGAPQITVTPDRSRLARYGIRAQDALKVVQASRVGIPVGLVYEGAKRFEVKVMSPLRTPTSEALGELFVETADGGTVPLSEIATGTMRAVLTTGAVAAFGFLPMALATGAGAEVQRPLATVVICGIVFSTALTLFVLPGVLRLAIAVQRRERRPFVEPANVDAEIA
jgi:Cu/Ag efflux pump CusA